MDQLIKDLLVNTLFIIVPIFLYHIFWADQEKGTLQKNTIVITLAVISMVLCMRFPVELSDDFIFDLRQIPFILSLLYYGYRVGALLLLVSIVYRFWIGGNGIYVVVISHVFIFLIVPLLKSTYQKLEVKKKAAFTTFLSMVTLTFTFFVSFLFVPSSEVIQLWVYMIIIQGMVMWGSTYSIEKMNYNLKLKQELARAEKESVVSQLAAAISHEVRNPLTVTKGFIQLLKDDSFDEQKRKEFVDIAIKELEHAEEIITDYLSFAKPSLSEQEHIQVSKELKRVISIVTSYANMQSIYIETHYDDSAWIVGDKQKFHQCFINLVKNSVEAMPNGGKLTLHTYVQKEQVVIEIQDSGVGMTVEQINRLGEPYFSTKEKGTGLGMVVVFQIIKSMNGDINIQSHPGQGTNVKVTFPSVKINS